jgi:hypothetical protein
MKSSSWLRNPILGSALGRARHTRRRKPPASRPQVEQVEERCLLSSYTFTDLTFPGGSMLTSGAINKPGQVASRGIAPAVNCLVAMVRSRLEKLGRRIGPRGDAN